MATTIAQLTEARQAVEQAAANQISAMFSLQQRLLNLDVNAPDARVQFDIITARMKADSNNSARDAAALNFNRLLSNLSPADAVAGQEMAAQVQRSLGAADSAKSDVLNVYYYDVRNRLPQATPIQGASTVVMANFEVKAAEASAAAARTGITSLSKTTANGPTLRKEEADAEMAGKEASLLAGMFLNVDRINADGVAQVDVPAGKTRQDAHKVSLREIGKGTVVWFDVLPEIVEQHTAEYEAVSPVQFPGAFQKFKGNASTQWTVNATFVSRTSTEASWNYKNLQILRGWTKPYFGNRTGVSYPGKLGAPPPTLMFSGLRNLIGPVPVVIVSLNWNWPKDVDYIATDISSEDTDGNFIPFPVVIQIPIQLAESYSIQQFNNFSLEEYRQGRMRPAFNVDEMQRAGSPEASELTTGDVSPF